MATESRQPGILGVILATIPFTVLSFFARLASRILKKTPLWYDDYFAILAFVSSPSRTETKYVDE